MDAALRSDGAEKTASVMAAVDDDDEAGTGYGCVAAADDAAAADCEHYRSTLDFVDRLTVTGRCCTGAHSLRQAWGKHSW